MSIAAISRLFGRSPFAPLQAHLEKVRQCVDLLPELFNMLQEGNHEKVRELTKEISKLEHTADLTKQDIRRHLPRSLFMPVDRASLLNILALQDSLADKAEDIAVLTTLREIEMPEALRSSFTPFLEKNLEAFNSVHLVIQELHELLESSFGGAEADKVKGMIDDVAKKEHQADVLQRDLLRQLFTLDTLPGPVFQLWMRILEEIGNLSNLSEKLGNQIMLTLETQS